MKFFRRTLAVAALWVFMAHVFAANLLFTNNASTTLAASVSPTGTVFSVATGTGTKFPALTSPQYFRATLVKNGNPNTLEIVKVTAHSGDTFTVVRAQEGTTAIAWSVNDYFNILITAADMADLIQKDDLQKQSGNYAVDIGTTNAYSVALNPALTVHVIGMPIRFKAATANTGAATFNDGAGALPLVTPDLNALVAGNTAIGGIYTAIYDGTRFQLFGNKPAFSQLNGQVGTGQVPQSAVTQYTPQILASAALTGAPTAPTQTAGDATTKIATDAFVQSAIAALGGLASYSTPGYYKFPPPANSSTQLIIEWGYAQTTGSGAGTVDIPITFPLRFPNACVFVGVATNRNVATSGQANNGSNFSSNYTQTGATITVDDIPGGIAAGRWYAIGY